MKVSEIIISETSVWEVTDFTTEINRIQMNPVMPSNHLFIGSRLLAVKNQLIASSDGKLFNFHFIRKMFKVKKKKMIAQN